MVAGGLNAMLTRQMLAYVPEVDVLAIRNTSLDAAAPVR